MCCVWTTDRRAVAGAHDTGADLEVSLGPRGGVVWVTEQHPLVDERVLGLVVDQTHVTLPGYTKHKELNNQM